MKSMTVAVNVLSRQENRGTQRKQIHQRKNRRTRRSDHRKHAQNERRKACEALPEPGTGRHLAGENLAA